LRRDGNSSFATILSVLHALGIGIAFKRIDRPAARQPKSRIAVGIRLPARLSAFCTGSGDAIHNFVRIGFREFGGYGASLRLDYR
jgi:hypothetical protein